MGLLPLRDFPGWTEPVKDAYGVGFTDLRPLTEPALGGHLDITVSVGPHSVKVA